MDWSNSSKELKAFPAWNSTRKETCGKANRYPDPASWKESVFFVSGSLPFAALGVGRVWDNSSLRNGSDDENR